MTPRFREAMIIQDIKWALHTNQLSYLEGTLRYLRHPKKYQNYIDRRISAIHRKVLQDGVKYHESFAGLPKKEDLVTYGKETQASTKNH